ncbi:hypothetical protein SCHPADRAFT_940404 [Schizopora paradoxa]|uniref:Uncharacterized protein n=1 Tax=Schizopora paradoxa TaxID=27342 RepID=A0A0H2RN35_9AGAM|nr:hypothetical protein SCHPADRAFT_940404 [Schizopora paradoxa]
MSSHFRSPFKPKPRMPIIVTTPAPQFALANDPVESPSTSSLASDSSRAYLRPPQPNYQPPAAPVPRPRSATFRSSPLAGSVVSLESLRASEVEDVMEDEKKIRRIQSMRERTGTGRENERDGVGRPTPTRVASSSELSTRSQLRFSDTFETREKLTARPAYAHLSSRRPLSELSILRPINNVQSEEVKEPPTRRTPATAPMSAEGMWRDSAEVPVFSRKLLKAQNVVMPVKAIGPGPSRLRKHSTVTSASARPSSQVNENTSSGGSVTVTRSKSESNLHASQTPSATVGSHIPAKLTRFRRTPSSSSSLNTVAFPDSHPSDGTSAGSSTTRKLRKLRAAISIPQIIREEERSDERPSQPEPISDTPLATISISNPPPPPLPPMPSSCDKSIASNNQGDDESLTAQGVSHHHVPSIAPQLPEIDTESRVFSWFGPRPSGIQTVPSSPTLTTLLKTLIPPEVPQDGAAPDSPRGSTTESLSEFEYGTSMSGQSTPFTVPGTPCLSTKGSLTSLKDLIAHINAEEVGKAISFYTSDDSDTKTAQVASLKDTFSDASTTKEQHFIDVPSSVIHTKTEDDREVKNSRLNLRRCTRLFPHPRPRVRSAPSPPPYSPKDVRPVKVVKRRPSFFERLLPCVKRSNTSLSSISSNGTAKKA